MFLSSTRVLTIALGILFCFFGLESSLLAKAPTPPQNITDGRRIETIPTHEMVRSMGVAAFSVETKASASRLYLVIDVKPVDGDNYSRGYGINNASQVIGRTYNKDESDSTEDLLALFRDFDADSQSLETLHGASGAWGINDAGMVCGFSTDASGYGRAVRWDLEEGSVVDLGVLTNPTTQESGNESYSYRGINDSQKVVGHAEIPNEDGSFIPYHAFIYDDTNGIQDLGTLYGDPDETYMGGYSIAYDINNSAMVVGISHDADWNYRAFIWHDDEMAALAVDTNLESGEWYATVINDGGLIGGHVIYEDGYYPYYWSSESDDPVALEMPEDYPYGEIYGINASGHMVGGMFSDEEVDHAFIFNPSDGVVDLNDAIDTSETWELQTAIDINDLGQITGIGIIDETIHAFLLTPVTDSDADSDVDGSDLYQLAQNMANACTENCTADFNDDGGIDTLDLHLLGLVLGYNE